MNQPEETTFAKLIHNTQAGRLLKSNYKAKYYDANQILNNFEKQCYKAAQTGADGAHISYKTITNHELDDAKIKKETSSPQTHDDQSDLDIEEVLKILKHQNNIYSQIHQEITIMLTKFCHQNNFKLITDKDDYIVIF